MSDTFQRIAPEQARQLRENGAQVVDIRDPQSFAVGHISGSRHIDNHSVADFIAAADLDAPLVVVCYHGNSSQSAAAYFIQQGLQRRLQPRRRLRAMAQRLSRGYQQRRSGSRPRRYPAKNCNFSRLSSFTPSRTNYSFPQAIQNRGEPAHRLPGHRL